MRGDEARPLVSVAVLRGVLAGVLCAGILGLAAVAGGRGFLKPPVRAAEPQRINVTLGAGMIDPAVMLLLPGRVRFVVRNSSGISRVFRITGPGLSAATEALDSDAVGTLDLTFTRPGTYTASDGRGPEAEESIRVRSP